MADELDSIINEPSEAEKRIKQLSDKVKTSSEERDAERVARETAEAKAQEAERKAAFLEGFSDIIAENPAAKEFRADIEAKVMSGMTLEDAKFVVLGKAGKLGETPAEPVSPAGGSAATALPSQGEKSVQEMTQDERRAALLEAEQRGDIGVS